MNEQTKTNAVAYRQVSVCHAAAAVRPAPVDVLFFVRSVLGDGTLAGEMARIGGRQQQLPDSHGRPRHDSHTVID